MKHTSIASVLRSLASALLALLLLGCAQMPVERVDSAAAAAPPRAAGEIQLAQSDIQLAPALEEDFDPLETVNRFIFAFNEALDVFIFKPLAATYREVLPDGVRDSVRNFLRNLNTPVVLANDLFQGDMARAEATLARFVLNSTVGFAGLFDVAGKSGWGYHTEDFGQTMAVHGAAEGAYLVLPIFGPSTVRDAIGRVVDIFLDPLTYVAAEYNAEEYNIGRSATEGIDTRSRNIEVLDDMKRDSLDFYARIRSLYLQRRRAEISNGAATEGAPLPGFTSEDENQLSEWE